MKIAFCLLFLCRSTLTEKSSSGAISFLILKIHLFQKRICSLRSEFFSFTVDPTLEDLLHREVNKKLRKLGACCILKYYLPVSTKGSLSAMILLA